MINHQRIESFGYCEQKLKDYDLELMRHIENNYYDEDISRVINLYFDNPIQGWIILKDEAKSNLLKQEEVLNVFSKGKSKIGMIIGARGSGKTATGFWIAENLKKYNQMKVYYVGMGINKKAIPDWCRVVERMNEVPEGVLAIVDETAIQFNPRESWKEANIVLGKQLAIARHHGVSILFITQHSKLADINIRRLADCFLWKISNSYEIALAIDQKKEDFWNFVRRNLKPKRKDECLFEHPANHKFIKFTHDLPDCWTTDLSKSWRDWSKLTIKKKEIGEPVPMP